MLRGRIPQHPVTLDSCHCPCTFPCGERWSGWWWVYSPLLTRLSALQWGRTTNVLFTALSQLWLNKVHWIDQQLKNSDSYSQSLSQHLSACLSDSPWGSHPITAPLPRFWTLSWSLTKLAHIFLWLLKKNFFFLDIKVIHLRGKSEGGV